MQVSATARFMRISPKKVRPFLKDLRGKKVAIVLASLRYARTKSEKLIYKLVHSAAANALNNYNLKQDNLKVESIAVNDGPRYRRYWFRSHGSADLQLKRTSHLAVILSEILPSTIPAKPVSTKPASPITPVKDQPVATQPSTSTTGRPDSGPKPARGKSGLKRIFNPRTTNK